MRARLTAAALLVLAGCGGDSTGPADVLQPGAYALAVAVGPMPGYRQGVTTYAGTLTLTSAASGGVAGTYALTRTFTPATPCGADCGPYVSQVTGPVSGAWTGERFDLVAHALEVRVSGVGACHGRERGETLGGPVFAAFTSCMIERE